MMLGQFWLSMRTSFVAVTKPMCLLTPTQDNAAGSLAKGDWLQALGRRYDARRRAPILIFILHHLVGGFVEMSTGAFGSRRSRPVISTISSPGSLPAGCGARRESRAALLGGGDQVEQCTIGRAHRRPFAGFSASPSGKISPVDKVTKLAVIDSLDLPDWSRVMVEPFRVFNEVTTLWNFC